MADKFDGSVSSGAEAGGGNEGRQSIRLPKAYTVEVKELAFPATKAGSIQSSVNDISRGGISIESPRRLEAGQTMQVKVHIPMLNRFSSTFFKFYENDAEQYFMAIAKVVWCKPGGGKYLAGMEFVNVDETQSRALAALIDKAVREAAAEARAD